MRMITHLSYPNGNSINHYIDPRGTTTSYQSFDYAVKIVAKYSYGCYISKGNVEAAFRILPILKKDWHLLGIKFNSRFYIDICLPFSASISCALFEKVGSVLQWLAHHRAGHPIAHYLDDFFMAHILQQVCDLIIQTIHDTCTEVGVTMALDKRVFATQIIEYLGLLIDTILMIIRIPQDKQRDLIQHLSDVITTDSATASSLQSLAS